MPELSGWRLLMVVLVRQPSILIPYWICHLPIRVLATAATGIAGTFLAASLDLFDPLPLIPLLLAITAAAAVSTRKATFSWRVPALDLNDQPRLASLITEAAGRVGLRRTPKVRLRPEACSGVWRSWNGRASLNLGLPLLTEFPADELGALLTLELIRGRDWTWRARALQHLYVLEVQHGPSRHRDAVLAGIREVRRNDWRTAAELAGEDLLARALRRWMLLDYAMDWYMVHYASPFAGHGYPADLYEAFRWKLREDGLAERFAPNLRAWQAADPVRIERGILDELGWGDGPAPAPPADPAVVSVLERLERRLCDVVGQDLAKWMGVSMAAGSYRLSEVAPEVWLEAQLWGRDQVITAATELLGSEATGDDVVELVRKGRAQELKWAHVEWPCTHPTRAACVLVPLLDVALRRRGYVPAHPYRQRELSGPKGDLIDVVEFAARVAGGYDHGLDLEEGALAERDRDQDARRLAEQSLADGDAIGWFERLYAEAEAGGAIVPWDSGTPHPLLVEWAGGTAGGGRRAIVVGCGLGDDAEYVASLGFDTLAFDVSESAVRGAQARFPGSPVEYVTADLLDLPAEWREAFDLVVEIMTVQSLPEELHPEATAAIRALVAPGGTLLVIAVAREEGGEAYAPPWPLTPAEIAAFAAEDSAASIEQVHGRWRAIFRRRR